MDSKASQYIRAVIINKSGKQFFLNQMEMAFIAFEAIFRGRKKKIRRIRRFLQQQMHSTNSCLIRPTKPVHSSQHQTLSTQFAHIHFTSLPMARPPAIPSSRTDRPFTCRLRAINLTRGMFSLFVSQLLLLLQSGGHSVCV